MTPKYLDDAAKKVEPYPMHVKGHSSDYGNEIHGKSGTQALLPLSSTTINGATQKLTKVAVLQKTIEHIEIFHNCNSNQSLYNNNPSANQAKIARKISEYRAKIN